mgnify:CR=1 FL=1
MTNNKKPIGVFDSGIGGLTVLEKLMEKFPNEDFIYVADQGHCPYGTKTFDGIKECVLNVGKYLIAKDVKAIVIACNTASLFIKYLQEITEIPDDAITVIASGPLTSDALAAKIHELNGGDGFYFYDAAAPIVDKSSIDMDKVYLKSRYDKGEAAYLNCPMTKEEFMAFHEALVNAEEAPLNSFEKEKYFEGCMPIEVMAKRGIKTMLYGPMKPVGLEYPDDYKGPRDGEFKTPYAVVQLRQDNAAGSLFNIVGFQTHLKWGEQKRVFRMIPGLENAEFVRYGVMHRNSYMDSPNLLTETFATRQNPNLFFAGQMTGVEGYVESAASGLVAGINAVRRFKGEEPVIFPQTTAIGALPHYITHAESKHFQPMNVNFGIVKELEGPRIRDKKERYEKVAERALKDLEEYLNV